MQMLSFILIKCKMHIHLCAGTTERWEIGHWLNGGNGLQRLKKMNGIDTTIILYRRLEH